MFSSGLCDIFIYFSTDLTPVAARLIVPLADAVVQECHAGLVAEPVSLEAAVGLAGRPVVELQLRNQLWHRVVMLIFMRNVIGDNVV
jgi:hypothetical protein